MLPFHFESKMNVTASAEALFSYLDDPRRLSSHMSQSSWMMAGSRMVIDLDTAEGIRVGSKIRLSGRVFGISLLVDEAVTERTPPSQKVWETIGEPSLLVIGQYRMGYKIERQGDSSELCVFIDYDLPKTLPARWIGRIFGHFYARWCTKQMAGDAVKHFR